MWLAFDALLRCRLLFYLLFVILLEKPRQCPGHDDAGQVFIVLVRAESTGGKFDRRR